MSEARIQKAWHGLGSYRRPNAEVIHIVSGVQVLTSTEKIKAINDVGSGLIEFSTDEKSYIIPASLIQFVELK